MTTKLEQAARQLLSVLESGMIDINAVTALREALTEQVEQEPVAVVDEIATRLDGTPIFNAIGKVEVGQKLYAAPVRTKDLTDDEILEITKRFAFRHCVSG